MSFGRSGLVPLLSDMTRKAFFAFIPHTEIANFTDLLRDGNYKDAHLLVYTTVVYLTLFFIYLTA